MPGRGDCDVTAAVALGRYKGIAAPPPLVQGTHIRPTPSALPTWDAGTKQRTATGIEAALRHSRTFYTRATPRLAKPADTTAGKVYTERPTVEQGTVSHAGGTARGTSTSGTATHPTGEPVVRERRTAALSCSRMRSGQPHGGPTSPLQHRGEPSRVS